jgi:hypothetical protein
MKQRGNHRQTIDACCDLADGMAFDDPLRLHAPAVMVRPGGARFTYPAPQDRPIKGRHDRPDRD